jgi:hypothetical protein
MNAFQEELRSLASKKYAAAKSQLERDNWGRLDKYIANVSGIEESRCERILCKYALWAAWIMNNRSPFHTGTIRKSIKLKSRPENKKSLPKPLHARMILTNNPNAKEYAHWISTKPNIFERPI